MPLKTTFGTLLRLGSMEQLKILTDLGFSLSPSTTAEPSGNPSVDTQEGAGKRDGSIELPPFRAPTAAGQAAGLGALAVIGPILAFPIVKDFVGRMAVVLVVGVAVAALRRKMIDSGIWEGGEQRLLRGGGWEDGMVFLGVYGAMMATIAMLF